MKSLFLILIFFFTLCLSGCGSSQPNTAHAEDSYQEFVIVPVAADSIPVSPATKYFYRFVYNDKKEWTTTPEWALGNLNHFGIRIIEGWYYPGSTFTDLGNGNITSTMVPPTLVVGLAEEHKLITDHHFEKIETFDPLVKPNGPRSRMAHYVVKGGK